MSFDPELTNPEHFLHLDLTSVDGPHRLRIIKAAQKAGGVVLNDDVAPLLDSAPPEPKQAQRHSLEVELSTRAPFSFMIIGETRSCTFIRNVDPVYKQDLIERLEPQGFKAKGITHSLKGLQWLHQNLKSGKPEAEIMNITPASGTGYSALTFNCPGKVTAERLIAAAYGLGDKGADTVLAILVEASRASSPAK